MSPAFGRQRRFIVGFESSTADEVIVLAISEDQARAKAKALYDLNRLAQVVVSENDGGMWPVKCLDEERCPNLAPSAFEAAP